MKRHLALLSLLMLLASPLLPARADTSATAVPSQGMETGRDVAIAWHLERYPSSINIIGQIRNIFYNVLQDVELRATLHDSSGRKVGKETVFFLPGTLNLDETAPYALTLQVPPSAVPKRISVTYKYREQNKDAQASPAFHSFDIPL